MKNQSYSLSIHGITCMLGNKLITSDETQADDNGSYTATMRKTSLVGVDENPKILLVLDQ
jgi:hypothetical protein